MHFLHVLPLALSASAFLIPAEIPAAAQISNLPAFAERETIKIECDGPNGCPVALGKDIGRDDLPTTWTNVQHGSFLADITVDDKKVLFNGAQVWPQSMQAQANNVLSIKQKYDDNRLDAFRGFMPMSTSLEYKPIEVLLDDTDMMVIHPVSIEILSVVDTVVHADSIELRIAETKSGVGLLPSRLRAYEASPFTDSCTNVWCRVKGTIAEKFHQWTQAATNKINKWRGCAGRKGGHRGHPAIKGGPNKFGPGSTLHPHGKPGRHGEHPHPHHHHHPHGFRHYFRYFIRNIFLPATWGLAFGSILGAAFWLVMTRVRALRARANADYIVVEQVEIEEGRASMDGPPKYEDVYRAPQMESEDEKKELLK